MPELRVAAHQHRRRALVLLEGEEEGRAAGDLGRGEAHEAAAEVASIASTCAAGSTLLSRSSSSERSVPKVRRRSSRLGSGFGWLRPRARLEARTTSRTSASI